ncbi:MAG: class I SAM-dependent methyltransferase [Pirellulales bacterium]
MTVTTRKIATAKAKRGGAYREDLAYIHDDGFGFFAADAAPWLLTLFGGGKLRDGLVIDLGCGSGIWARALDHAGYQVLGYDISPAMVALAAARVPRGQFRALPLLKAPLKPCVAVTAIGEVFNYLFDKHNSLAELAKLFERVYTALRPGGLFVFDVATPGRVPGGLRQSYREGPDWACLFEAREDPLAKTVTRYITTFRKDGSLYRRDREVHRLQLYERAPLMAHLRDCGFRVRTVSNYGKTTFPPGYLGFVAQKPA